jgi:hypothetical protein
MNMALDTSSYKTLGIIMVIALVGVIFVVVSITTQNKTPNTSTSDTKPFLEATSGVVVDAPTTWTVGKTTDATLTVANSRVDSVLTSQSTCSASSSNNSTALENSLLNGSVDALKQWQAQFTGLVSSQIIKTKGGMYSLIGIDTCNPSLTVRTLTFRGQAYKNDVEVQFSHIVSETKNTKNQTDLNQLAQTLIDGTAATDLQQTFNQFRAILTSVR